ncbi:MAG: hypothetical protein ACK5LJ_17200 [Paracoccus sp. (in: a-proteobacteria)]
MNMLPISIGATALRPCATGAGLISNAFDGDNCSDVSTDGVETDILEMTALVEFCMNSFSLKQLKAANILHHPR